MTISSTTRTAGPFTGNDVTTVFAFTFKVFVAADLLVVRRNTTTNVEETLVLTTDYTVSLNADQDANPGGSVTLLSALATGYTMVITSAIDILQAVELTNGGGFYPSVINAALDRLTIIAQQLDSASDRSPVLPTSVTGVDMTLPVPVANKYLGWNSTATGLENRSTTESIEALLASTATTSDGAALVGYKHQTGGAFTTGASATTVQDMLDVMELRPEAFGAAADGTDDSTALQATIDAAEAIITAGGKAVVRGTQEYTFSGQLTITATSQVLPDIFLPHLVYSGVDTQAAIVIGASGSNFIGADLTFGIRKSSQSDWTETNDIGIVIYNASACQIRILRAKQFRTGLQFRGDGASAAGFVYNNVHLGDIRDNRTGLHLVTATSGWVNENLFIGGKFDCLSSTNTSADRFGVVFDSNAQSMNANTFVKPSFELSFAGTNTAYSIDMSEGTATENITSNHFIDVRQENGASSGTNYIADFTGSSDNNLIDVSYSANDVRDRSIIFGSKSTNVVRQARNRVEYVSNAVVLDVHNLLERSTTDGSGTVKSRVSGMVFGFVSGSVLDSSNNSLTIGSDSITIANGYLGVVVDTSVCKQFLVAPGYTGSGTGRVAVICFDSGGSVINTGTPVVGTADRSISLSTSAYVTGSDNVNPMQVQFSSDVKTAFIGFGKGTGTCTANSLRIYATDYISGKPYPTVLDDTSLLDLSPHMRYVDSAPTSGTWRVGTVLYNTAPSAGGTIGWVCTTAGTPGTWKTWGAITA